MLSYFFLVDMVVMGDRYDMSTQWIGSGGKDPEATAATVETATLHRL